MAKSKKATDHQGELRRYEVLSPIKFAGRVTKRGSIDLPEAVGEALRKSGHVAPAANEEFSKAPTGASTGGEPDSGTAKTGEPSHAPKADAGSQAGAVPNNPREESGRSAAAGQAGGSASSAETEAAAPKQAPAGNAKQPATKAAGKTPSKKAK